MERRKGDRPRVHGVGTHSEQLHPDSLRGHVACSPIWTPSGRSTRHSWTSHTRTIAYPIRICCLDHWLKCTSLATTFRQPAHTPCIPYLVMAKDFKASVLHVSELSIDLSWISKNSPQSWIALVIKLLTKNTKTYTIWLEMIARVLNMPIGLKGNKYYLKVFKRVNYKLWNNPFWVVITTPDTPLMLIPLTDVARPKNVLVRSPLLGKTPVRQKMGLPLVRTLLMMTWIKMMPSLLFALPTGRRWQRCWNGFLNSPRLSPLRPKCLTFSHSQSRSWWT